MGAIKSSSVEDALLPATETAATVAATNKTRPTIAVTLRRPREQNIVQIGCIKTGRHGLLNSFCPTDLAARPARATSGPEAADMMTRTKSPK